MAAHRTNPDARIIYKKGAWWHEDPGNPNWIMLGFAPTPKNRWQTFRYHILHGLIMRYPIRSVLSWSWRNRSSFHEKKDYSYG